MGDIVHQDLVALVAQGPIADRTSEHLGASDEGIILMRRKFFSEMKRLEEGDAPLFALPSEEGLRELPFMGRDYLPRNRPTEKKGFDAVQGGCLKSTSFPVCQRRRWQPGPRSLVNLPVFIAMSTESRLCPETREPALKTL